MFDNLDSFDSALQGIIPSTHVDYFASGDFTNAVSQFFSTQTELNALILGLLLCLIFVTAMGHPTS